MGPAREFPCVATHDSEGLGACARRRVFARQSCWPAVLLALPVAALLLWPARSAQASRHYRRPEEKRVWWRDDLLPPAHWDRIGLHALEVSRKGRLESTKVFQYSPHRLGKLVYTAIGEGLVSGTVRDINDDGLPEVVLTFAPPGLEGLCHMVVLTWSTWDKAYVVAGDLRPAAGARWRIEQAGELVRPPVCFELVIDEPTGTGTLRTTRYRLIGERLVVGTASTEARWTPRTWQPLRAQAAP